MWKRWEGVGEDLAHVDGDEHVALAVDRPEEADVASGPPWLQWQHALLGLMFV